MVESSEASSQYSVIFVLGPTASGKTDLSFQLSQVLPLEIINADSVQSYEYVNIGSAKPKPEELEKIKHHLIGWVSPPGELTAGGFREKALEVIKERIHHTHLAVVGGSGFYIQALEKGMYKVPQIDSEIKKSLDLLQQQEGEAALYKQLIQLDPEYANKTPKNDRYRIFRALSLVLQTKKTMAQIQEDFKSQNQEFPFRSLKLGLKPERDFLRKKVRARCLRMLDEGFKEEVIDLLNRGLGAWAPLSSVGYKEMTSFIEGKLSMDEMVEEIVKNTMRLAKRQITWFKRDSEIHWIEFSNEDQAKDEIAGLVKRVPELLLLNRELS